MTACATNEYYDWHAERCVPFKNWCDQNSPEMFNLYHRCVDNCDAWKIGQPDYDGQFDLVTVLDEGTYQCTCPEGHFWAWSDEHSHDSGMERCFPNPPCGKNLHWNAIHNKCLPDMPEVPVDVDGVLDFNSAPMCHSTFTWDPVRE